jgi:DNA adenine methylase
MASRPPHPIPYQGSKRRLAPAILAYIPDGTRRLVEPCCGSAAVSLAALHAGKVRAVHLNDSFAPLARLWDAIVAAPARLAAAYERVWRQQLADPRAGYDRVRYRFNRDGDPARLLYLLARCVKSAVRFNAAGAFNQSPDRRRLGTQPARLRASLVEAGALLAGRATVSSGDYADVLAGAGRDDVVYLDPPWQGTSGARDQRYHQLLDRDRFVTELERLVARDVPVIVSFDGRTGERRYGEAVPRRLGLRHIELAAGRSSQATLNGGAARTYESLYVSPALLLQRKPLVRGPHSDHRDPGRVRIARRDRQGSPRSS